MWECWEKIGIKAVKGEGIEYFKYDVHVGLAGPSPSAQSVRVELIDLRNVDERMYRPRGGLRLNGRSNCAATPPTGVFLISLRSDERGASRCGPCVALPRLGA